MSRWLARLRVTARALFRRRRVEEELNEEFRYHLDRQIGEELETGDAPGHAWTSAVRAMGPIAKSKEECRDMRGVQWLDALLKDLRFGARTLARRPGFTTAAILTLAIGIGATTAIFSLIDSVLVKPLPFPEADRLVTLWETRPRFNLPRVEASPLNYLDWQEQAESFDGLAAYVGTFLNLTGSGPPERLAAAQVTPNLFPTLGVEPILGRWFVAPEGAPGRTRFTILGYGLWQRRFGGDPEIIGRTIRLDGEPHRVVGVMPRGFQFPRRGIDAWVPVDYRAVAGAQSRDAFFLSVVGRLRENVSVTEANAELQAIAAQLARAYPENAESSAAAVALRQDLVRNQRTSYLLLLAAAVLVLLIACANVAGLLVTRGAERDREFALRRGLGASRAQLARQLFLEGLLLSSAAGLLGLLLAVQTFDVLEVLVPESLRGAVAPSLDLRLLALGLMALLLTGIVFGLVPLRYALRMDLRTPLNDRRTIAASSRRRSQAALVAGEVALALVVLFSTGLMIRTILNLQAVDPGFRVDHVLTAQIELTVADYPTAERQNTFYREALDRVMRLPGVVSAGFTTFLPYTPLIGAGPLEVEGQAGPDDASNVAIIRVVTPDYLETLGVPLLSGRGFSYRDTGTPAVALVSERVSSLFEGDPVGQRVAFLGTDAWMTVVGVVGDIKGEGLDTPNTRGTIYMPSTQQEEITFFSPRALAIRTESDPLAVADALQHEIWELNPNQTIADVRTLESVVAGQISDRKVQTSLFTAFGGLALFMAALGVYGLMSFLVTSRTRELGVRRAMGAQRGDIVTLIARDSILWVGSGLAGGLALTMVVSRGMSGLLFGVEPLDWISLTTATCVLGAVAAVAALVPVWRATRVDPLKVLRAE